MVVVNIGSRLGNYRRVCSRRRLYYFSISSSLARFTSKSFSEISKLQSNIAKSRIAKVLVDFLLFLQWVMLCCIETPFISFLRKCHFPYYFLLFFPSRFRIVLCHMHWTYEPGIRTVPFSRSKKKIYRTQRRESCIAFLVPAHVRVRVYLYIFILIFCAFPFAFFALKCSFSMAWPDIYGDAYSPLHETGDKWKMKHAQVNQNRGGQKGQLTHDNNKDSRDEEQTGGVRGTHVCRRAPTCLHQWLLLPGVLNRSLWFAKSTKMGMLSDRPGNVPWDAPPRSMHHSRRRNDVCQQPLLRHPCDLEVVVPKTFTARLEVPRAANTPFAPWLWGASPRYFGDYHWPLSI